MAKAKSDGEKKLSQRAMVQAALDSLGAGAMPTEINAYILKEYNVNLPNNVISNYKSNIKRDGGLPGRKRGRPAAATLQIEDFAAVRGLVQRLGADQVKRMIDVVS